MTTNGVGAVIREARRLFYEQGFDATSMQDVADALGLHKSTLYHHVRSKDELLERSCRATLDGLGASLDEAVALDEVSDGERLRLAFEGAVDVALGDIVGTNVVINLRETSEVGRKVLSWRRDYERHFTELVRAAQRSGEVRDDVDPALLARVLLGTINWVVTWYRPDDERFALEEVRRVVNAVVGAGAVTGAGVTTPG